MIKTDSNKKKKNLESDFGIFQSYVMTWKTFNLPRKIKYLQRRNSKNVCG